MIDIDLIDSGDIDGSNRVRDRMRTDPLVECVAVGFGKKLGVAQTANAIARLEYAGGGNDGAKKRASTDFIHTRDEFGAGRPGEFLEFQRALEALKKAKLGRCRRERFAGFGIDGREFATHD